MISVCNSAASIDYLLINSTIVGGAFSVTFYWRWKYQIVPPDLTFTQRVAPKSIQKVTKSDDEEVMVPVAASPPAVSYWQHHHFLLVSSSNQSVPAATCVQGWVLCVPSLLFASWLLRQQMLLSSLWGCGGVSLCEDDTWVCSCRLASILSAPTPLYETLDGSLIWSQRKVFTGKAASDRRCSGSHWNKTPDFTLQK